MSNGEGSVGVRQSQRSLQSQPLHGSQQHIDSNMGSASPNTAYGNPLPGAYGAFQAGHVPASASAFDMSDMSRMLPTQHISNGHGGTREQSQYAQVAPANWGPQVVYAPYYHAPLYADPYQNYQGFPTAQQGNNAFVQQQQQSNPHAAYPFYGQVPYSACPVPSHPPVSQQPGNNHYMAQGGHTAPAARNHQTGYSQSRYGGQGQGQKATFDAIAAAFSSMSVPGNKQYAGHMGRYPYSRSLNATAATSVGIGMKNQVPRGPPQKPRQSGHALWVGNLPPNAVVVDLKDHFSREATNDILSVKLMAVSNCAFVNYKNHVSCEQAMKRFHDSFFHGVRLVCRLRKPSVPNSAALPPSLDLSPVSTSAEDRNSLDGMDFDGMSALSPTMSRTSTSWPNRYFVLKSLTFEDLIVSVRTHVWTTQPHNEERLNAAFKSCDNVYLVFSVNKSGEYFGYGRMASLITESTDTGNDEQIAGSEHKSELIGDKTPAPPVQSSFEGVPDDDDFAPKATSTSRTEHAPRGRIVDDSARGTIFWEVDDDGADLVDGFGPLADEVPGSPVKGFDATAPSHRDPSKSFKVDWLTIRKVPFYRTRGMRNPLNGNREVKIARDGTEIVPDVGARLLELFNTDVTSPQFPHN